MSEELFASLPSGCRICYQVFGNPSDTAILLISGHSCAMTQKTDWIIGPLSPPDHPHFIIRFDHRDTGRSASFTKPSDGTPVYTLDDMVEDIVGLIKHLKLTNVHLVGTSLGGTLAWQTASRLPDVVRSLALVLTSPVGRQQIPGDDLPRVHYREKESGTMWTKYNHSDASGVRWPRELLKQIRCPTVVIHAAKDQIFPLKHAEALRDDVEGATLVIIEGCGHEIPHRVRQQMVDAILANVKKGE